MQALRRAALPSDVSRCHGDNGSKLGARCRDCARREQLQHDDKVMWFPVMFVRPREDGSCVYWIREETVNAVVTGAQGPALKDDK